MSSYISDLRNRLHKSYELASRATQKAQTRQKTNYDLRARGGKIEDGDRVLVKIVAFEGKHRIANRWEEDPYVVIKQPNMDIPVYVVQKENGEGRKRTLHRNLLLPIGQLNFEEESGNTKSVPSTRRPKAVVSEEENNEDKQACDTDSSDDESDVCIISSPRRKIEVTTPGNSGDDQSTASGQAVVTERDASGQPTTDNVAEPNAATPDIDSIVMESSQNETVNYKESSQNKTDKAINHDISNQDNDQDEDKSTHNDNTSLKHVESAETSDIIEENLQCDNLPLVKKQPKRKPRRQSSRYTREPKWMRDGQLFGQYGMQGHDECCSK